MNSLIATSSDHFGRPEVLVVAIATTLTLILLTLRSLWPVYARSVRASFDS